MRCPHSCSGLVEYHYLMNTTTELELKEVAPGVLNWQEPVYEMCVQRWGNRHRWMGEQAGGASSVGMVCMCGFARAGMSMHCCCQHCSPARHLIGQHLLHGCRLH